MVSSLSGAPFALFVWSLGAVGTTPRFATACARRLRPTGQSCAGCHETDRFVGEQMDPWMNQSAYRFSRDVAYIFKLNGFPIGTEELQGTGEAMRAVRLEVIWWLAVPPVVRSTAPYLRGQFVTL